MELQHNKHGDYSFKVNQSDSKDNSKYVRQKHYNTATQPIFLEVLNLALPFYTTDFKGQKQPIGCAMQMFQFKFFQVIITNVRSMDIFNWEIGVFRNT